MILIDYNQMIIANFMQFRKQFEPGKEDSIMRHMVLNNIKMVKNVSNIHRKYHIYLKTPCCKRDPVLRLLETL